jgi:diguanylate cyclase (GGDEF)-like protein
VRNYDLSSPPTLPGPAQSIGHGDRPTIGVFAADVSLVALTETLSAIGYQTVPHRRDAASQLHIVASNVSAVVIDDSIDEPLKWAEKMSAHWPVLLITCAVSTADRLAAARSGVDAIVVKPLDVGELGEWLNDLVGPHRETPLSVLIVDDDDILAHAYGIALENAGMRAIIVTDPLDALQQMTATYPDLILMDVQMPGMNGIELARIVRQSRRYLALPIVFLSAEQEPSRQLEARKWGGDDFISKPVDPVRLAALVKMRADRAIALRSMMHRDSLTGLLNHGRFIERLYQELERCRRTGAEVSLVLLDLDRFKNINDTFGHVCGDQVLRALAQTLSGGLRKTDVLGRYGGEEFGVLLLDTSPKAAYAVAEKIRQRFSEIEFNAKWRKFSATFSAGVSGSLAHATPETLISSADEQMYLAKAAGRNRIVVQRDDKLSFD